jgi:hypothetical protein
MKKVLPVTGGGRVCTKIKMKDVDTERRRLV